MQRSGLPIALHRPNEGKRGSDKFDQHGRVFPDTRPHHGELPVIPRLTHAALYAAFDLYPSAKGAAAHISRMAQALFGYAGGGLLYVLGDPSLPVYQREGDVEILRFAGSIANFLDRTRAYADRLDRLLEQQQGSLRLCHFRDPWGGIPILARAQRGYATVYEINGLPSIELPHRYPLLAPRTLEKLRAAERYCWEQADLVLTPSETMGTSLLALGVPEHKIAVVPNGADLHPHAARPVGAPPRYLIYFGALQPWQGVPVLLRAFARLADLPDLQLVVCASTPRHRAGPYRRLAAKLGVAPRVIWQHRLAKAELAAWVDHAEASVAPLTECPRNLEQGCCPLKILESMAAGTPVVASDLPAVRELMEDGVHGRLVRPDRPAELARALRLLLEYPQQAAQMGARARARARESHSWSAAQARLTALYESIWPTDGSPELPGTGTAAP
jgi:glycosyltransferase involved in cell wall biosynthesis